MDKELKEIIENSESITFFGGAGVSTESNIPDFRSKEGLYATKMKYGMSPERILSHSFFVSNSETFFDYYKNNLIYLDAKENMAHIALAKLEKQGKLKGVITQNIDGLHQKAGSEKVLELHGSVLRNYCIDCGKEFQVEYVMEKEGIPYCDLCNGIVRPDVVLYEEALDDNVVREAISLISSCDTLIVGGTSLVVYPAAGLIEYFRGKNLVLINKSSTGYDSRANLVIQKSIGEVLGEIV